MATELNRTGSLDVDPLVTLHAPPISPPQEAPISERVGLKVVNQPHFEEATLRNVIQPCIEIDDAAREVSLISQGLSLSEEKRTLGTTAILIEVAARYRRGEGAIKQLYRYLVFTENGKIYCQRLPMGSWAPSDPDVCLEWLGRGGFQQGDFVLLPRKRIPPEAREIVRPQKAPLWKRALEGMKSLIGETMLEDDLPASEWHRLIGRHDPVDCKVYLHADRLYLDAPQATVVEHPEHATLNIHAGRYEIVEDRASSYWRKAID
jgi:hypothetical protein